MLEHELRELSASRSYWLMLVVIGALVGHALTDSVDIYAEASGIGGGPAALAQGLSPLEGIVVPTLGAYDLAATLLFPFVVIRLIALERQSGSLALTLQAPMSFARVMLAKSIALLAAWVLAGSAGAMALLAWRGMGGHLAAAETWTVILGHVFRGLLTIGIGAAAGALASSAASAAIVALTITLGTWALDYVAAARGGTVAKVAAYTPSSALRVFEHGELRVATVAITLVLGITGLTVAAVWLQEGRPVMQRARTLGGVLALCALACVGLSHVRASRDVSEDRRNSFPRGDEAALAEIKSPLRITAYLSAEDPRLVDLERGVFAKLRRTMRDVRITYMAEGRTGLFEKPNEHYGEIWYALGGKTEMLRSSTQEIVLETIYRLARLAGRAAPLPSDEVAYAGYPLAVRATAASWLFFVIWPSAIVATWWVIRRPRARRRSIGE